MKSYAVLIGLSIAVAVLACSDPATFESSSSSSSSSGVGGGAPAPCTPGEEIPCVCPNNDASIQVCEAPGAWGVCKGCPTATSSSSSSSSSGSGATGGAGGAPVCIPMDTAAACAKIGATCGPAPDGCDSSVGCGTCGEQLCYKGACCTPRYSCAGACGDFTADENCGMPLACDLVCGDGIKMSCKQAMHLCACKGGLVDPVCPQPGTAVFSCGPAPNLDAEALGCTYLSNDGWCCPL